MKLALETVPFNVEAHGYNAELIASRINLHNDEGMDLLSEAAGRVPDSEMLADEVKQAVAAGAMLWVVRGSVELPFDYKTPFSTYALVQVSPVTPVINRITGNAPDCRVDRLQEIGTTYTGLSAHAVAAGKYAALKQFDPNSRFRDLQPEVDDGYRPPAGKILGPISRGTRQLVRAVREGYGPVTTVGEELSYLKDNNPWIKDPE